MEKRFISMALKGWHTDIVIESFYEASRPTVSVILNEEIMKWGPG